MVMQGRLNPAVFQSLQLGLLHLCRFGQLFDLPGLSPPSSLAHSFSTGPALRSVFQKNWSNLKICGGHPNRSEVASGPSHKLGQRFHVVGKRVEFFQPVKEIPDEEGSCGQIHGPLSPYGQRK